MDTIKHYQNFPCMKPWIGKNYSTAEHKKLLIIGESHYLPKDSNIHLDAEAWYKKQQSELTSQEVRWISTSGIIKNNKDSNFKKKAHSIYRNTCSVINTNFFNYTPSSKAIEHYAFYNFFQRPADVTGDSICLGKIDKEVAISVFKSVYETLEPELIIFTSSLAGKIAKQTISSISTPFIITPHPSCAWWNRVSKKYNGGTGKELIPSFLKEHEWLLKMKEFKETEK